MIEIQIATYLVFRINNGFLNGRGNIKTGKGDISSVKQFQIKGINYPYISAQAWRKWLRDSISFDFDHHPYHDRLNKTFTANQKKTIDGLELYPGNPVISIEDDLFGYSRPLIEIPQQDSTRYNVVSTNRQSVINTTPIMPLMDGGRMINQLEGFVHLDVDTPLPYKNEFMNGNFHASITMDYNRIGVYSHYNDIYELDPHLVNIYLKNNIIEKINTDQYRLKDLDTRKKQSLNWYFDGIVSLYATVKTSQFAVDITPRIMVTAILRGSSNIFHDLVKYDEYKSMIFDIEKLVNIVSNRGHELLSDIYIGYRSGTFNLDNEEDLIKLNETVLNHKNGSIKIHVISPGKVKDKIINEMGGIEE